MPELPEVETVRRGLSPALVGRRIVAVDVRDARLRYPVDRRRLAARVVGREVIAIERRAKYLIARLRRPSHADARSDTCLVVHLGMTGGLRVFADGVAEEPHTHVVFELDDGRELRFRDPRRFGLVDALRASDLATDRRFTGLGVEPLSDECDGDAFFERTRGRRKPVKNWLMDASQVVGVGNIYACEALFRAGVHPQRAVGRIGKQRWGRLTAAVQEVLRDAIDAGGTTLSDFRDAQGGEGYFRVQLSVYGREGEPCPQCGETVRRRVMAGRSTYYCSRCQR